MMRVLCKLSKQQAKGVAKNFHASYDFPQVNLRSRIVPTVAVHKEYGGGGGGGHITTHSKWPGVHLLSL